MAIEEDPFFGKTSPPIHMPEIIPVQAFLENDESDLWADQRPRHRPPVRLLLALLALGVLGGGSLYLATRPNSPLESAADQLNQITSSPSGINTIPTFGQTASPTTLPQPTSSASEIGPSSAPCQLPLYTNQTSGFQIGQPLHWTTTLNGPVILVAPEATFQTVSFLLPIELVDKTLAESVTKIVAGTLNQSFKNFGAHLTLTKTDLAGTVGGVPTLGWLTVI